MNARELDKLRAAAAARAAATKSADGRKKVSNGHKRPAADSKHKVEHEKKD